MAVYHSAVSVSYTHLDVYKRQTQDQVRKLIAGNNNVFICDECIELCGEILEEELGDELDTSSELDDINLLKPKELKEFLDEYVICLLYTSRCV